MFVNTACNEVMYAYLFVAWPHHSNLSVVTHYQVPTDEKLFSVACICNFVTTFVCSNIMCKK